VETARTDTEQAARAITGRPIPQLLARASSIALSSGRDRRSGAERRSLIARCMVGLDVASANPHDYRNVITENARGNCNFELALRGVFRRLRSTGVRDRPTSPRSPWQNAYAERLIGSIRRECLDYVVVLGERHLRHVLLSPRPAVVYELL